MNRVFILVTIFIFTCSCSNDDDNIKTREIEINVTINNSNTYDYNFGRFGDDEGVEIQIQAAHFEISELGGFSSIGQIVYRYRSASGYVGNDYVEIIAERGSDGTSPSTEIRILRITFNVIE